MKYAHQNLELLKYSPPLFLGVVSYLAYVDLSLTVVSWVCFSCDGPSEVLSLSMDLATDLKNPG